MQPSLQERVAGFPNWHYRFELGDGVVTPIFDEAHVNRHRQRQNMIIEPLVRLCGGDLRGKRVLDLGCNAGFWSLQAVERGCDFVLGVDGRQMHIDQAELVFECKGVDRSRYVFEQANVFDVDLSRYGSFDVVLCLGLMYHVSKPVELFELMSGVDGEILVIDTETTFARRPSFRVRSESVTTPRNSVDHELVLVPSRQAVTRLAEQFGYAVRVLRPIITDGTGMADYAAGKRRVFVAARMTDLSPLSTDSENPPLPAAAAWAARRLGRRVQRRAGAIRSGARAAVARPHRSPSLRG